MLLNNRADLFTKMAQGSTIITPNNRLSQHLLRDYVRSSPDTVHDKPRCLPYLAYLQDCYKRIQHLYPHEKHPVLFNAHQERLLWHNIISQKNEYPCNEGLLNEVQNAWTRCQLWSIDINNELFLQTPQTQQFQVWQHTFLDYLTMHHAITDSQLVPYLLKYPIDWESTSMIWVSFDDFTPQQRLLQSTLASQSITQHIDELQIESPPAMRIAALDTQDELQQLVLWLNAQLDANLKRIAVIVPDLHQQSQALQRYLVQHIEASQFELSIGKSLADYPLVSHALHWLALDKTTFTHHQIRLLLHSPYLGGALSEFSERSKLLEENRLLQEAAVAYTTVLATLRPTAPKLANILEQLTDYPIKATPQEWIAHFKARLTALQFPGEYALNSSAYQYLQRLQALFDEFLLLAHVQPLMTKAQALNALRDMIKATVFQIRKTPSPIQILGLLEASGCEFDAIWVIGLTDQCLPQKVKLSPFIPIAIQRQHQMPHALPERELHLAKKLLERFQNSCQQCIFSYPRLTGDTPNLPSPLIQDIPIFETSIIKPPVSPCLLIKYDESYTYPVAELENLSGGTAILAHQAQCPFRAFASHRLHAKARLTPSTGLNDADRGQIIHKLLEVIWKSLGSQQALLNQSTEALDTLLNHAIDIALEPHIQQHACSFPPLIQAIERDRLRALIQASFLWEKQRPPFIVKAVEQAFTLNLAGIDFSVRVDRLDSLSEDETWVIDYKSSIPPSKPWNEERPEAPQLLLYALLDQNINALLFLQLKTGQLICNGISQDKNAEVGLSPLKKDETWSQKREEWRQRLTQLTIEFRDGHCPPNPQKESTCLTCEYKNLCRI